MHAQLTPRRIAQFPTCPRCKHPDVTPVSDAPVFIRIGNGEPQKIGRSEAAAYLRFLQIIAPCGAIAQQLYLALRECINVSRVRDTLRRRFGAENFPCEKRAKAGRLGTFGIYYLPEHVQVWDAEEGEASG